MRHSVFLLCAVGALVCITGSAFAATNPNIFTLDLLAPCSGSNCGATIHATDIDLQTMAGAFSYTSGSGADSGAFLAYLQDLQKPMVCGEVSSGGALGASALLRLKPEFSNPSPGGVLEFDAGGPTVVDFGGASFDGSGSQPIIAASYSNYNAAQVQCYQANPISGSTPTYTAGPDGIFAGAFEDHFSNEPWLSVQTVNSPTGIQSPSLGYVVQIHNASRAVGWRVRFGYDFQFFDKTLTSYMPAFAVLSPNTAQPGPVGNPVLTSFSSTPGVSNYTVAAGDIQSSTDSVYVYVVQVGSGSATSNWSALTTASYPAAAAIFPPFGTYPQRLDDKVAVSSSGNLPTQGIAEIVCNNDTTSTSCQIYGADGYAVPQALVNANKISGAGVAQMDPAAYEVDPASGSTLPGNSASDALTASAVSCSDPNGVLSSPPAFSKSSNTPNGGALSVSFNFAKTNSNPPYKPGTVTCSAKFTAASAPLGLSVTKTFRITMLAPQATHFSVNAPASATAGSTFSSLTVTALDGSNVVASTYNGTVHFTSTDTGSATQLPADVKLVNGTGTFSAKLTTAGSQTITATDTVNTSIKGTSGNIAVSAGSVAGFYVVAPGSVSAHSAFSFTVVAQDAFGNQATGYGGTVHFGTSPTDAQAKLPGDSSLSTGYGTFSATLVATGTQHITAADTSNSSINGTSNSILVN